MTIRVGVDGSGPSRAAITWAAKRSARDHEALELVHVVDGEWGQLGEDYADDARRGANGLLADALEVARRCAPDAPITTSIRQGSTAWELAVSAEPGDLLVVGTHKTGYLSGRVLGTRSVVVASTATSSVAVIPDTPVTARRGVVVGVAEGTPWEVAVTRGAQEAAHVGNELSLVNAAPGDGGQRLLADAAALAADIHPALVIRRRVSRRRPAEALLDASRSAGLLVLGATRADTARAGYLGSTTHEVLLNLNSPVLIARA
ncbi:nucleotide-binding universal stress UspA family protein [Microbacteriaceae bacterium SG_E_30_P1]|uniref:Nucleotide-binding universal stress UspA family protein n=1 Tax=Antiquaquibacter oligotrophicus TaxID=2880260 RepID=A0ABT6KQ15_9MICO|nr:universal stress protein [Antiquaquibacter oligotrophicus]MDH6182076.1 nucleotide-binding universal stress UspA family protein [Antiquaquibacter oligotrophicus]UDF12258.1 universal stress protein [Antiquaquibacter oligotrophicus]